MIFYATSQKKLKDFSAKKSVFIFGIFFAKKYRVSKYQ